MIKLITLVALLLTVTTGHTQEIALTFDDAPTSNGPIFTGKERTEKILNHLREKNVDKVAFFVITGNIDVYSKLRIDNYAKAGHFLANHTHSHRPIQSMGLKNYITDMEKADDVLKSMPGFKPWFRYPFLDEGKTEAVRDSIRAATAKRNLTNGYVTVDTYDWYINNLLKEAVANKMKVDTAALRAMYIDHVWKSIDFYDHISRRVIGRSVKHVLLLHENDLVALFIGDLIDHIRSKGWRIISPNDAYRDPIASQIPNTLFNGQGRVAAIAREKGIPGNELVQDSEDEVYLQNRVKELKIFK